MKKKIYAVMYRDYSGVRHLRFVPEKRDVEDLKRNYDVVEIDHEHYNTSFLPTMS